MIDLAWFTTIVVLVLWPIGSIARTKSLSYDARVAWAALAFLSAPGALILAGLLLPLGDSHLSALALPLIAIGPWAVLGWLRRRMARR